MKENELESQPHREAKHCYVHCPKALCRVLFKRFQLPVSSKKGVPLLFPRRIWNVLFHDIKRSHRWLETSNEAVDLGLVWKRRRNFRLLRRPSSCHVPNQLAEDGTRLFTCLLCPALFTCTVRWADWWFIDRRCPNTSQPIRLNNIWTTWLFEKISLNEGVFFYITPPSPTPKLIRKCHLKH